VLLKDLGRYSEASDILRKAYLEHVEDKRILPLLAKLSFLDGQTDDAIKTYKNILRKYPNDVEVLLFIGLCFKDKNDFQQAKRYFKQALVIDKNNIIARISLAELYFAENSFKESAEAYNVVYSIDPSIVSVQKRLGDIYFSLDNPEQALKIYRKLKAIDSDDKKTLDRLMVINNLLGKAYFDNEKKILTKARKERTVFVKPFSTAKDEPIVKVKLISGADVIEFKCSVPFEVKTRKSNVRVFNGMAGQHYFLSCNEKAETVIKSGKENKFLANEPVLVELTKPEGTVTLFLLKFTEKYSKVYNIKEAMRFAF